MEQQVNTSLCHTDLKVGHIYNRERLGCDDKEIDLSSKTTFELIAVTDRGYETQELFTIGGNEEHPQVRGNVGYFPNPESICKNHHVYECSDPAKWHKHKVVMDIEEAYAQKLISRKDIQAIFRSQAGNYMRRDPVTYYGNGKRCFSMEAKPTTENPRLHSIGFTFKNTAELKKKIRKIYPQAWFMN